MRTYPNLPSFSNVTAGSTATLELPLGRTFDKLFLRYSGVTLAQLKSPRLEVNGKTIWEFKDAQELANLNKYYKRNTANGVLDFNFKRDELQTLPEQRYFGLATNTVKDANGNAVTEAIANVTLRVDIDAAATAPVLSAEAIQSDASPMGIGWITKHKNFYKEINAGVTEFDNLPKPQTASLAALHLITDAEIEEIEIMVDSFTVMQIDKTMLQKIQVDHERNPQADRVTVDFMLEGDMTQAIVLRGVQHFNVKVKSATAAPVTIQCEYLDKLSGI